MNKNIFSFHELITLYSSGDLILSMLYQAHSQLGISRTPLQQHTLLGVAFTLGCCIQGRAGAPRGSQCAGYFLRHLHGATSLAHASEREPEQTWAAGSACSPLVLLLSVFLNICTFF